MVMLKRLGRLFTIKTRLEAWLIIYAIALGAVERARHYLETYPGAGGWALAVACTGVVFLAGAKLLDAVRPVPSAVRAGAYPARLQRRRFRPIRSRPRARLTHSGSRSPFSLHRD